MSRIIGKVNPSFGERYSRNSLSMLFKKFGVFKHVLDFILTASARIRFVDTSEIEISETSSRKSLVI